MQMRAVQWHDISSNVDVARVNGLSEYGSTFLPSRPPSHVGNVVKCLQLCRLALVEPLAMNVRPYFELRKCITLMYNHTQAIR